LGGVLKKTQTCEGGISPVTLYGEIVRRQEYNRNTIMENEIEKQGYIDWLDTYEWSFWCTLTTPYQLTQKSGRRRVEAFHKMLKNLSNGQCILFFVLEPFGLKEGFHIHCLIQLPESFHEPHNFQNIIDTWQICVGTYKHIMNDKGERIREQHSRIDLKKYKKDISASGYCTKYIMKGDSDYDILI
jgi:hypothetical protein